VIMKFSVFVGVSTTVVGTWVLAHGHALSAACTARANKYGAAAVGFGCTRAISTLLMGVALTTGGLVILAVISYAFYKNARATLWTNKSFTVAGQPNHTIETVSQ
jgi:hypothetical protein